MAAIGSAACAAAIGVKAQGPDETMVVVASRVAEPLAQAVGTLSVLKRNDVERTQAHDVRDLLRYEPGVAVTGDRARFGFDGFNIRGIEGNRIAIEVDGVPLPSGFSVGRLSRASRDSIEPELIERMEILRGPASTLHGSDALGGIVAITTRRPSDLARQGRPYLGARLSHTTEDQGSRASVLGAWQGARFGALALASHRRGHETANNTEDLPANPASTRQDSALLQATGEFGPVAARATLERYAAKQASDVRSARLAGGQFANTTLLLTDDRDERTRASLALTARDAGVLAETAEAHGYWQSARTVQRVFERRRAAPPAARAPVERSRDFELDTEQAGLRLLLTRALHTGPLAHKITYGADLQVTKAEELRDGSELNLLTRRSTHLVLGEALPVRDFPRAEVSEWGVFVADEIKFGDSPWALVPGLRIDGYEVDSQSDLVFRADNPRTEIVDISTHHPTPKLALRYHAAGADDFYLAYSEGFRAAPFTDVNIALVLPQFNYEVRPNPALEPERSRGLEAGWQHATSALEWRLAGFYTRYKDFIDSRANLGVDPSGVTIFQSVNRDRARIFGVEAQTGISFGEWLPALEGWRLHGALAWAQGDDLRRERPLNTVAPPRLTAELLRKAHARWPELALAVTAAARQDRLDRSAADLFATPGYVALDLRTTWQPLPFMKLNFGVFNLLDKYYWEWGDIRGITRQNSPSPRFFTAAGRYYALTFDIFFR